MKFSFDSFTVLDGSTGFNLQKAGMPAGVCPELWICEHPEALIDLQRRFVQAGSDGVYAPTFGANRKKLSAFGLADRQAELCEKLVRISREAVQGKAAVGGDMSSPGMMLRPFGDADFETLYRLYREQALCLEAAGVDFYIAETLMSLAEARAAVAAIKSVSDKPIAVTMTFDGNGRTLTGGTPLASLLAVQSMGADAFGINCSEGPETVQKLLAEIAPYATIPLISKPNAGMPVTNPDGTVTYPLDAQVFADSVAPMADKKVRVFGGCCGTNETHIAGIRNALRDLRPEQPGATAELPQFANERRVWQNADDCEELALTVGPDFADDLADAEADPDTHFILTVTPDSDVADFEENQYQLDGPVTLVSADGADLQPFVRVYNGLLQIQKR